MPTSLTARAPRAHLFGLSAAMVTPFTADGAIDTDRAATHAEFLMQEGLNGLTLFGTTGEGASLGTTDRACLLDAVRDAGVPSAKITVAIVASDFETAGAQIAAAQARGVERLLLAPPFYFKGVSQTGLGEWVTRLISATKRDMQIILYHIPQVTGVAFDAPLVRQLKDRFSDTIFGVKDSAGDWDHTASLLPMDDLAILVGDERLLARAAPLGGAGAISGMGNLLPARVDKIIRTGAADPDMDALVDRVVSAPVTPLVKALVGGLHDDPGWSGTRPPLEQADSTLVASLLSTIRFLKG
ncbi:dihydrodipicolinate synthase family protein [Roseinatronobacter alkalisoli]|uniref:Dihydrodipicolinate synthase family protein n=1 Tax=Roseinatronobacter alkalisoli TaxID=3028235 RepID=A0ABT5TCT4_9RHOB|nr:dihydrodipicolinate synthase family protein [Roseinatronobacter sp. HJB301]MDD7972938.1 dihydrodipicolinate synthase family protein [Roseinatronobacter sp. HJB301]